MLSRFCFFLLGALLLAACAGGAQSEHKRVEVYGEVKAGYEYQRRH